MDFDQSYSTTNERIISPSKLDFFQQLYDRTGEARDRPVVVNSTVKSYVSVKFQRLSNVEKVAETVFSKKKAKRSLFQVFACIHFPY